MDLLRKIMDQGFTFVQARAALEDGEYLKSINATQEEIETAHEVCKKFIADMQQKS